MSMEPDSDAGEGGADGGLVTGLKDNGCFLLFSSVMKQRDKSTMTKKMKHSNRIGTVSLVVSIVPPPSTRLESTEAHLSKAYVWKRITPAKRIGKKSIIMTRRDFATG